MVESRKLSVRVSNRELRTLEKMQQSSGLPDVSSTVRFCIGFTQIVLSIIPEAVGEAFIDSITKLEEENA